MLLSLRSLNLSYGDTPLLKDANLTLQAGERVALVGRNGTGKSTLLRIIAGTVMPDSCQREQKPALRIARLQQNVPEDLTGSAYDIVAQGLGNVGQALARFHQLTQQLSAGEDVAQELATAQEEIAAHDGWNLNTQVETILSQLNLAADLRFENLSGGLKRRVLLAQALVTKPDLLLLDEPTNHLDIQAIEQLETIMLEWPGALLFITHDRALLKALATRIVDLDRGQLVSYPGDYPSYLEQKTKNLEIEAKENAAFDKKLAQEEAWIRQGIKARRTRNEGRVRALKALRKERSQRIEQQGKATLKTQEAALSGKKVILAENISYDWDDKPIVRNFSCLIQRGDKIGVVGPNGSGKTTLVNLLLGKITPKQGTINLGTQLAVAHFDQHRAGIDDNLSVIDNVAGGSSSVTINGKSQHIISYLQDFLFSPRRAQSPARVLSGGERNRLLLAKLFTQPANLLVMDEPTNDLDIETLKLLEEKLIDYNGTLLLVSHDRAFMDNVVTSTLVFEGNGQVNEYVGGYSDWLNKHAQKTSPAVNKPKPSQPIQTASKSPKTTLSRAEQKELYNLPAKIEKQEAKISTLEQQLAEPGFYEQPPEKTKPVTQALAKAEEELMNLMERWELLEEKSS